MLAEGERYKLILGDCIEKMKELEDNSVHAIITDPPYGLEFMGKDWDNPNKYWDKRNDKEETKENEGVGTFLRAGKNLSKYEAGHPFQKWVTLWATEALRVLKTGGFLFSFGGTRTHHRLTCGLEDAGFLIRDEIAWAYATGFPKAQDLSKLIDKRNGSMPDQQKQVCDYIKQKREELGLSKKEVEEKLGWNSWIDWIEGRNYKGQFYQKMPNWNDYQKLKEVLKIDDRFDNIVKEAEREVIGKGESKFLSDNKVFELENKGYDVTKAETPLAKKWQGWKTPALKPAFEPIIVCQKPVEKTIVDNVMKHEVGGYNIDECRIPKEKGDREKYGVTGNQNPKTGTPCYGDYGAVAYEPNEQGRYPANILCEDNVLDDGIERKGSHNQEFITKKDSIFGCSGSQIGSNVGYNDSGSLSRFFDLDAWYANHLKKLPKNTQRTFPFLFCPKASKSEKEEGLGGFEEKLSPHGSHEGRDLSNPKVHLGGMQSTKSKCTHPTVKPLKIMQWIITLCTKEEQTILDPFTGSGTTGVATLNLNRKFIGIEQNEEYIKIAEARIKYVSAQKRLD